MPGNRSNEQSNKGSMREAVGNRWRIWFRPLVVLGMASLSLLALVVFIDYYIVGRHSGIGLWSLIVGAQPGDAQQMVSGLTEVVAALLGILITVASIIVELAATRYTPRITEMFVSDKTNLSFLAFFVVTSVYCIWVTFSIRAGTKFYVPVVGLVVLFVLLTMAILAMTPYFAYVFHFLDPQNVVARIRQQTVERSLSSRALANLARAKDMMIDGIEELSDVALNTLENKDKIIASRSIDALRDLGAEYLVRKKNLPEQWFEISGQVASDPDFVAMTRSRLDEMSAQKTWVEYKLLRQYQMVYAEALNRMRDINYEIAINTRYLGTAAIEQRDDQVLGLAIKFFNTFMRATLNARDVRTAYNILNQYRQLVEAMIAEDRWKRAVEVGGYLKYYAQVAFAMKLSFVTETVAYDLGALCEVAHKSGSEALVSLLEIFLQVDKEPEAEEQETSLRGVRKAQIKLATYFLAQGEEGLARRVFEDMKDEKSDRLRSIYAELMGIDSKDFWEIIDRGENFDYLDARRKQCLAEFFGWFDARVTEGLVIPGSARDS